MWQIPRLHNHIAEFKIQGHNRHGHCALRRVLHVYLHLLVRSFEVTCSLSAAFGFNVFGFEVATFVVEVVFTLDMALCKLYLILTDTHRILHGVHQRGGLLSRERFEEDHDTLSQVSIGAV